MRRLNPKELFKDKNKKLFFAFAPLEPFTTSPIVREIAGYYGAKIVCRPKINPHHLLKAKEWQYYQKIKDYDSKEFLTYSGEEIYDGIQLLSRPDDPIKGAVRFINKNKRELNISYIDLNFCCPGHKVLPHNRGGELLKYPEKMRKVIEKTLKFTSLPVSVKIRRGYTIKDSPVPILQVLKDYDLAWITINRAPVKIGNYNVNNNKEDLDAFSIALEVLEDEIPIICNGNLHKHSNIEYLKENIDVNSIMIGRGAMGNPYLFKQLSSNLPFQSKLEDVNKIFENMIEKCFFILNKYTIGESGRYTTLAQVKNILFYFIKSYFEIKNENNQLPHGLGFVKFTSKKFSKQELIDSMAENFEFISFERWKNWLESII